MKVTGVITTTSVADGATTTAVAVPIVATGAVVEPGITAVAGERTETTRITSNSSRAVDKTETTETASGSTTSMMCRKQGRKMPKKHRYP